MQLELKRIQTEVGITFIHVTHDQEEALTMADTVAVMNGGRVEQLGAPAELYETPRTPFVARFLGTSNLIGATAVSTAGGEIAATAGDTTLRLPADRCARLPRAGERLLVGVRPEKITLVRAEDADTVPAGRNRLSGTVAAAGFLGVSTQYLVESPVCPPGERLEVYAQNIERDTRLVPGAPVVLHWNPVHTFGLDAEPGTGPESEPGTGPEAEPAADTGAGATAGAGERA